MSIKVLVRLNHLDVMVEDEQIGPIPFGKVHYLLEQALVLGCVAAQGHAADQGILPHVLKVELSR